MKNKVLRRILVSVLTLTTVFSSLGTTVVYAVDGEMPAMVYDDDHVPSEDSIFELVNDTVQESSGADGSDTSAYEDSAALISSDAESEEMDDASAYEDSTTLISSDIESIEESDASVDASSEESSETDEAATVTTVIEPDEEGLLLKSMLLSVTPAVTADLSNPDFGEIIEVITSKNELDSAEESFEIGFKFRIANAEMIPEGKFTYTLPDSLDFSKVKGNSIPVIENAVEIGTAIVGDDNVITFEIKTDVLEKKPNGLIGSVGLSCKVNPNSINGDGTVEISFSDTQKIQIVVKKPIITGEKGNVSILNEAAKWTVTFDVSADADNFEITDVLGDNLVLNGGFKLSGVKEALFEQIDDHTLKVTVAHIEAGKYTLEYKVKPVNIISTDGMSEDEIFAAGNGNTVTWNWDGASEPFNDTGYATMKGGKLIKKTGKYGNTNPNITADGVVSWEVYINNGAYASDISGCTFADVLDPNMVFEQNTVKIVYSDDQKYWRSYNGFEPYFVEENGQWKLKIDFPENTPVHYYKLTYSSKIRGKLPTTKTGYTNYAGISRNDVLLDEAQIVAVYKHSGSYETSISKEIAEERNAEGIVPWKAEFTVSGEKSTYNVMITDTIKPDDSNKSINGADVVSVIVPKSVVLYRVQEDGTYKKIADAHTKFKYFDDNKGKFQIEAKMLEPGNYVINYQTQDYYGSEDVHSYPQGSSVKFNNNIQIAIDNKSKNDNKSYEVSSEGLPMIKGAFKGYYDQTSGKYVIPWTVTVNKNDVGQTNKSIAAGAKAEITDVLPENLSYRSGSTKISSLLGETIATTEPQVLSADNGKTELKWAFTWPEGMSETDNACVISFETVVSSEYLSNFIKNSGSSAILSFDNTVSGDVAGVTGEAKGSSMDAFTFLDKRAVMNEKAQAVDYSIVVNDKGLDLVDGDTIILSDEIQNGVYVTGSLHVYDYAGGVKGNEINIPEPNVTIQGTKVEIAVPDSRAILVEYQVKPDSSKGEEIGDGKIKVAISNTATLRGKSSIADTVDDEFVFDKLSANISSAKGAIRITKVDADNVANGLAGAKFGLYRVNLRDKSVSEVTVKETNDPFFNITFSEDGKYDSLIFDTLYYYEELEAPKDYQRDQYRHFVIFRDKKFDSVIADVKEYVNDYAKSVGIDKADLEIVDVTSSGKIAEFVVKNSKKPELEIIDPPIDPNRDDDTPETPETPNAPETPVSQESSTVITLADPVVTSSNTTIALPDLPEVLGASRNPDDLPEVLGVARGSDTGDSDMTGAVSAMIMAFMILAFVGIRRNKETTGSEKM